jgi:hypothetical protein
MQTGLQSKRRSLLELLNKVTFAICLCFSIAGLMTGFALGGFVRHQQSSSYTRPNTPAVSSPALAQQAGAKPSPTPENLQPANPVIGAGDYVSPEVANGTTMYKLAAQILNKATGQPIQVQDVTCRLWLTSDASGTQAALSANNYALPKALSTTGATMFSQRQNSLELYPLVWPDQRFLLSGSVGRLEGHTL